MTFVLENIVYMELLRRGYMVTVGKIAGKEIDFVCEDKRNKLYVQVSSICWPRRIPFGGSSAPLWASGITSRSTLSPWTNLTRAATESSTATSGTSYCKKNGINTSLIGTAKTSDTMRDERKTAAGSHSLRRFYMLFNIDFANTDPDEREFVLCMAEKSFFQKRA